MKALFDNSIVLNEERYYGTVYALEDGIYLFRHQPTDLYFYIKKGNQGWYESGGGQSHIEYSDDIIRGVGAEIDLYLSDNPTD